MAIDWNQQQGPDFLSNMLTGLQIGATSRENERNKRIEELQDSIAQQMGSGRGLETLGTSADFNTLTAIAPEIAQQQMRGFSQISGERRNRYVNTMLDTKNALEMGNSDGALSYLDRQIASVMQDGGDPSNTQYIRNLVKTDPASALAGLKKMEQSLAQTGAVEMTPQDKKRQERRVQSTENLDGGSLLTFSDGTQEFKPYGGDVVNRIKQYRRQFKPELTAGQIKTVIDAQDGARTSRKLASEASTLATKLSNQDAAEGILGRGSELWKGIWGSEDEVSSLRKNYTRLTNEFIIKSLPPGIASDRDIELIRAGYLEPTADKTQVSNFLQSLSRVQQDAALYDEFRAAFLERSGGIQVADRPFEYKGVKMDEGMSMDQAYTRWVDEKYGDKRREESGNTNSTVLNWEDL